MIIIMMTKTTIIIEGKRNVRGKEERVIERENFSGLNDCHPVLETMECILKISEKSSQHHVVTDLRKLSQRKRVNTEPYIHAENRRERKPDFQEIVRTLSCSFKKINVIR